MAPERQRESVLANLTTRQKVIAAVLIIILLVLLWQIFGLFTGGTTTPSPVIKPAQNQPNAMNANTPPGQQGQGQPGQPAQPVTPPASTPQAAAIEQPAQVQESPVSMNNQILDLQKKTQQKYIDDLNQLQMLKIQREIAETNQAIASARLATVTAEKNVSDLLTKPSQAAQQALAAATAPPPLPPEAYAAALGANQPPQVPTEAAPQPAVIPSQYVVISVSMQFGRWSAVLGYQGKLYNVSIGDVLPTDGSVVSSINKNGVVLVKQGKRRRVSLISSV